MNENGYTEYFNQVYDNNLYNSIGPAYFTTTTGRQSQVVFTVTIADDGTPFEVIKKALVQLAQAYYDSGEDINELSKTRGIDIAMKGVW